jgi:16S rRNA (guanine966-N2)-methyltransferase
LLEAVVGSDVVTEDTIVIIEYPVELLSTLPPVVHSGTNVAIGLRNRKYGRTVVALYMLNPSGRYPLADRRPEEFLLPR